MAICDATVCTTRHACNTKLERRCACRKELWDRAEEQRDALLFKQVKVGETAADGSVIKTYRRPFPLNSHPGALQLQSAGIGLYFRTLWYFLLLMLMASLLAIYPIFDNVQNNTTTTTYSLLRPSGADNTVLEEACPKNYSVAYPFVLM